jgi:hypothetical protein
VINLATDTTFSPLSSLALGITLLVLDQMAALNDLCGQWRNPAFEGWNAIGSGALTAKLRCQGNQRSNSITNPVEVIAINFRAQAVLL